MPGRTQSGKVFCLSEGPNKDAVLRVHKKAGHATEEIYEVPIETGDEVMRTNDDGARCS